MKLRLLLLSLLVVLLMAGNGFALELGINITIPDTIYTGSDWYGEQEDQEVEPNCLTGQIWDLEAFFLSTDPTTGMLYMVGGYDFVNGQGGWDSGDIFIDVTGDALYGSTAPSLTGGTTSIENIFGYDYVLDMNFASMTYDVYKLDSASVIKVYYAQNEGSNPWRYDTGGDLLLSGGPIIYHSNLSDKEIAEAGATLTGDTHNVVGVSIAFLEDEEYTGNALFHYTYECGNDNLMGRIPDASALMLLGSAMLGVAIIGRKKVFSRKG